LRHLCGVLSSASGAEASVTTYWSGSTPDGALHQTTYTFTINGGETHTPGFSLDTVYAVTWNANTGCYAQAQSVGGKAILWHSPCAALSYCWWHWSGSGSVNMVCKQYW
jgi:hypothetical protein